VRKKGKPAPPEAGWEKGKTRIVKVEAKGFICFILFEMLFVSLWLCVRVVFGVFVI
jgi:hypothetical protein